MHIVATMPMPTPTILGPTSKRLLSTVWFSNERVREMAVDASDYKWHWPSYICCWKSWLSSLRFSQWPGV